MHIINDIMAFLNSILWHQSVLYSILATGVVFTIWSGFSQYYSLTHGLRVISGRYDEPNAPGAISHFQALCAAVASTVGLGNIGGVALAISLGGPGAVFWMWIVGFIGMSIKTAEVNLSMLHRNIDDPSNPHGGPMWVISKALSEHGAVASKVGKVMAVIFCVTLLVATITGGNMFQAWNVSEITHTYFNVPPIVTGFIIAALVGLVIVGGIKRIGAVTGRLVPIMVIFYIFGGCYVLFVNNNQILDMFMLIFRSAFSATEATGAFIGGTVGTAFLFGMKRAIFSSEAGQGSSPIAHCAVKTNEPAREGVVAGLEPFIDTLVVCTFTALVILCTGVWDRSADAHFETMPELIETPQTNVWTAISVDAPKNNASLILGESIYIIVSADKNQRTGNTLHHLNGTVVESSEGNMMIEWSSIQSSIPPSLQDNSLYVSYVGAVLTAKAYDTVLPGLGKWLVTIAVWFFAISTMITASYYGEQAVVFMFGERAAFSYKVVFCLLTIVSCLGFITTDTQLDNLTGIGLGFMLAANLPILWLFSRHSMRSYKDYKYRMKP
ncbi:MAG: amino acid carrier protein [Paraglaciecola sp.]|uniref:alanine/glycine:cation symporter family protein n=1 Tax=Paraglaciecola sp. TaxID=1920173 RepID=UPI003296C4AF